MPSLAITVSAGKRPEVLELLSKLGVGYGVEFGAGGASGDAEVNLGPETSPAAIEAVARVLAASPYIVTCPACGGSNVQVLEWISPVTRELIGGNMECSLSLSDQWCVDCDKNVELDWNIDLNPAVHGLET